MPTSAIQPYPIDPIAQLTIDPADIPLAAALLGSVADHRQQLRGRRIWLACSGGRDSLALAALCVQLYWQGKLPFLPQLLHVDHGLQANSSMWAQHVAQWAAAQSLTCTILTANVPGMNEQAARQARYQVMREHINQGDVLMLAHHGDDQAETLLMRLIQGAGVKGLAAMQPWREQVQQGRCYALWRPWLTITRAAISDYAKRLTLPYIDDPTNDSGDNVRSGLRREVMPVLATYNPNVIDNITRSAQLLSEAQEILTAQAKQDLQRTTITKLDLATAQRVLDINTLQSLSTPRQTQLLHYWLTQDEPLPPTKQLVDDVYALTQRHDQDHQTQLDWFASYQHYRIARYRQQLYRLSHDFLAWLATPIIEQSRHVSEAKAITIRSDADSSYHWQLVVDLAQYNETRRLKLSDNRTAISLTLTSLTRQQKIQTSAMNRAQAGKKLYQTLGIPVWLRESLVLISVVTHNVNNKDINKTDINERVVKDLKTEIPLLLLSPFTCWTLSLSSVHADMALELSALQQAITPNLWCDNKTSIISKVN